MRDPFRKQVTWQVDAGSIQEMGDVAGGRDPFTKQVTWQLVAGSVREMGGLVVCIRLVGVDERGGKHTWGPTQAKTAAPGCQHAMREKKVGLLTCGGPPTLFITELGT